jgi:tetratricopeptide (TPR) repeat protein
LINLAIAEAKNNNMSASISAYKEIAEINFAKENVTLEKDKNKLVELYQPTLKEYVSAADKYIAGGLYKEAISELAKASNMQYGEAKKKTLKKMFDLVGVNPAAGELSEEARKYALRSEMLVKEADFNGAESELLKAIQLAPYDSKLYFNMAIINSELKHYQEAIYYMKIYVEGVPDTPNNRQAKDEIIKWEFMLERGK